MCTHVWHNIWTSIPWASKWYGNVYVEASTTLLTASLKEIKRCQQLRDFKRLSTNPILSGLLTSNTGLQSVIAKLRKNAVQWYVSLSVNVSQRSYFERSTLFRTVGKHDRWVTQMTKGTRHLLSHEQAYPTTSTSLMHFASTWAITMVKHCLTRWPQKIAVGGHIFKNRWNCIGFMPQTWCLNGQTLLGVEKQGGQKVEFSDIFEWGNRAPSLVQNFGCSKASFRRWAKSLGCKPSSSLFKPSLRSIVAKHVGSECFW
jgi:hypothetical protein